jgi:hypothetical protein
LCLDQITQITEQTSATPVPEEAPFLATLREGFGDHTFYVDSKGLHIFESAGGAADGNHQPVQVMKVASWTDAERTSFESHAPEAGKTKATLRPAG